jgi:S-adenosylmethionine hydrolase
VGSTILQTIEPTYDSTPSGEPLMLFGSTDLLEIAVNAGNASKLLSIRKGSPVNIVFLDEK